MPKKAIDFYNNALSGSLGDLISSIGEGVGDAQAALDRGSLAKYLELYQQNDEEIPDQLVELLRSIGYQPTFYTIPETEVEAKVALSISAKTVDHQTGGSKVKMYGMPSNPSNVNQFNAEVNSFATLKFKILPVPPPEGVDQMIPVPNFIGLTIEEANDIAENEEWNIILRGQHKTISNQFPVEGKLLLPGGTVVLEAHKKVDN
ncbi:MAG: hypothetical protein LAT54_07400 [Cryomorphaceae bacterium]|nr:hypothetical protein [Cryomorphaceae bacterium]